MMPIRWKQLLAALGGFAFIINACTNDVINKNDYPNPIFVVNEGLFQNGTGTITYFNRETTVTVQDVFEKANNRPLGNIAQSMAIEGDHAFILVNNANKLEVVNTGTFVSEKTIEGLALPRYILPLGNGKAYISQWGSDGLTGSVEVLNLSTFQIEKSIPTGKGPENMVLNGNTVYVANAGGYGVDSTITLIDIQSNAVIGTLTAGINPNSLQRMEDGTIWALSTGDYIDHPGQLFKIKNNAIEKMWEGVSGNYKLLYVAAQRKLYYLNGYDGQLMVKNVDDDNAPVLFKDGAYYGLGYDSKTDRLLLSKSNGNANGMVYLLDATGTARDSFDCGVFPGFLLAN